jgi:tRNA(Ser,Leu) C12 N-acetylase TAN1
LIPQLLPRHNSPAVHDPTKMADFDRVKNAMIHHMDVALARISQQLNDRLEQELEAMRTQREQQEINLIIAVEALKSRQSTELTEIKRMVENLTNRVKILQDTMIGGAQKRVRPMEYSEVDFVRPDEFF